MKTEYKCGNCKRTLLAKEFYSASLKYGYMSCKVCTDEKRKSHKEGILPTYKVYTEEEKIITPRYYMPSDLPSVEEMGQVYIIGITVDDEEDTFNEPVKIGYTVSSVKNRLNQLNSSHWKSLRIIHESGWVYYPKMLEKYFHTKFAKQRIDKEWFKLNWDDYDEIISDCEDLPSWKYDVAKEFFFLKECESSNLDRINLLSRLYPNILDADWYGSDKQSDDANEYWNEPDMRYFYENCYAEN